MECMNDRGCTLDAEGMAERVRAWQEVSSKATAREVGATKATSEYPRDPALIHRLKELIAAEAICCSFLTFGLREESDRVVVELEFPEDARPLVEGVVGASQRAVG